MLLSPATEWIWSPQLQIHIFLGESTFKYYRQIEPCVFQLISRFQENRLGGRSRRGTFLFDSWIVNHINLLSYRHSGVCGDLCGFNYMALLTWNLILYTSSYSMFSRITGLDSEKGLRQILRFSQYLDTFLVCLNLVDCLNLDIFLWCWQ